MGDVGKVRGTTGSRPTSPNASHIEGVGNSVVGRLIGLIQPPKAARVRPFWARSRQPSKSLAALLQRWKLVTSAVNLNDGLATVLGAILHPHLAFLFQRAILFEDDADPHLIGLLRLAAPACVSHIVVEQNLARR